MIQKLPTNSMSVNGIMLADILPTVSTAIATTTATATITKSLNLSADEISVDGNENAIIKTATTMATGNVRPQLIPLFHEMLAKATPKTTTTTTTIIGTTTIDNNTADTSLINKLYISNDFRTFETFSSILKGGSASITSSSESLSTPTTLTSSSSITSLLPEASTTASIISFATETIANTTSTTSATTTSAAAAAYSYLVGLAWPKALIVAIFLLLILITIVGNTLVILAVLTTRRLRTVTNCFVMNLAITDWLVGTCVMPPSVILYVVGNWRFGWILCDIWISLDVLLCTGSILSLCAISLDRYLAVTQPLTYSKKRRSKRLALFMIFIVWITALSITCPPYLGWYEQGRRQAGNVVCRYNQNKGYVVFSAMGSFFIPLAVMMYVYLKIGYVLTSRRQRMVRDANSERTADHEVDCDNFLSESEHFQCATPKFPSLKTRWTINGSKKNSIKCEKCNTSHMEQMGLRHEASFYELVEISRLSSLIHCSALSCKYGGSCIHTTPLGLTISNGGESNGVKHTNTLPKLPGALHFSESRASFSETCLTTTTSTMTSTTLQNVKFNDDHLHHHQSDNHHHQQQQQQQHHQQQQQKQQNNNHHHHHHHHQRIPMRISTTKRDTKTAKTLTIVMGGFVVCWLPFFVYYLLIPFLPPKAVIEGLQTFLTWVGWVNCAINPFIYAFYNPDFRIAFWRLTCRRICKQKTPSNHLAMFRG